MMSTIEPGTAPIKSEYLVPGSAQKSEWNDDEAEGRLRVSSNTSASHNEEGLPYKSNKKQDKARKGVNKGRRFAKVRDELDLCWRVATGSVCEFGSECKHNHDIDAYLSAKPQDLTLPNVSSQGVVDGLLSSPVSPARDSTPVCPLLSELGECRHGFKCRFLAAHVRSDPNGTLSLVTDDEHKAHSILSMSEVNFLNPESQKLLRSKKYQFPRADTFIKTLQLGAKDSETAINRSFETTPVVDGSGSDSRGASVVNHNDIYDGSAEKKRLNWSGLTYLAPLTTVGNLPFRRLCIKYGADITCGEMGLATSFLSGSKEEWSLVRRHPSEKIFGVQLAGNKPQTIVAAAEAIANECAGNIDFVDVNCGCPIDLVFNSGSGSALLDSPGKLGKMIVGLNKVLGNIPVTVKLRTGVKDGKNNAHILMPRLSTEWKVACMTLHGRTRQQRYTKLADWDYIKQCVDAVRERESEIGLDPVPIFGGGDCFSSQDYWEHMNYSGVDGVMVGRGALIKPWIFTEIKERREWDISAHERLEMLKEYVEYGLCHFGSDTAGVNTTRRYLCEALSFQYRYIPLGILERLPSRINDRAPAFIGRNDLETLLASPKASDWIKISEFFLGAAPATWHFIPKHKSNAYESQG